MSLRTTSAAFSSSELRSPYRGAVIFVVNIDLGTGGRKPAFVISHFVLEPGVGELVTW